MKQERIQRWAEKEAASFEHKPNQKSLDRTISQAVSDFYTNRIIPLTLVLAPFLYLKIEADPASVLPINTIDHLPWLVTLWLTGVVSLVAAAIAVALTCSPREETRTRLLRQAINQRFGDELQSGDRQPMLEYPVFQFKAEAKDGQLLLGIKQWRFLSQRMWIEKSWAHPPLKMDADQIEAVAELKIQLQAQADELTQQAKTSFYLELQQAKNHIVADEVPQPLEVKALEQQALRTVEAEEVREQQVLVGRLAQQLNLKSTC